MWSGASSAASCQVQVGFYLNLDLNYFGYPLSLSIGLFHMNEVFGRQIAIYPKGCFL